MSSRILAGGGLAVFLVLVFVMVLGRDGNRVLRVPLDNAAGLEDGSAVRLGGETIGEVDLDLGERDEVTARLKLREDAPSIGRDVRVAVKAANFLGTKRVELLDATHGAPVPDDFTVARRQVTTPTDLDQVLAVLDAPTRTRLQVLIGEAGEALVGRKLDLRSFLRDFPLGERDATVLVDQLATDNTTMRNLFVRADRFVGAAARERRELTRLVDEVGRTAETVSVKRAALMGTLDRAPGTLRTLRGALGDLERTTTDLGPAARELTASAPALVATLDEVEGFRASARPTLAKATEVAPDLTKLAKGATPVLRRARPTVERLAELAAVLPGVTDTLDGSVENIFAVLQNWSRAIQFRDGLSHVFRGEASVSPELVLSAVRRFIDLEGLDKPKAKSKVGTPAPKAPAVRLPHLETPNRQLEGLPKKLDETVKQLPKQLQDTVKGITDALKAPPRESSDSLTGLLDLLLAP